MIVELRGTKDVDLKLHNLGDKSFLIYCNISPLISLFSLSFSFSGFLPSLTHKEQRGYAEAIALTLLLNWTELLLPSISCKTSGEMLDAHKFGPLS